MRRKDFEDLVVEAIAGLPAHIRKKMDNVAVVIEDSPTPEQYKKGGTRAGSILLGLYEGIPKTKRGSSYTLVLPDKITIFQNSIELVARTPEAIKAQVRQTMWHEIAHHFGFDEAEVQKLSRKRRA